MTKKERLLTAMRGGTPDRVPCAPDTNWTIPVRLKNLSSWQVYYHNDPPIWKAYNDCVKYYGVEGFSHHGYYDIPDHPDSEQKKEIIFQNDEKMVVKTTFRCPAGDLTQEETFLYKEPPTPTKRFITDFVKQFDAARYLFFGDVKNISFKNYELMRKDMGDNGAIGMCMYLPTLIHMWREPLEACYFDYFEHHELVTQFIEEWTDHLMQIAHAIVKSNIKPDFIFFPNSGSITLQSEDILKEYTVPALKKLTKIFKTAGITTSMHSCGKERALVEAAAMETDLDCIDPLEIAPMGDTDFKEVKEKFGKKIALKGNLHTTDVMLFMDAKGVEKEAIKLLEIGKPGGGFILSTGDQCGRDTPDENIFKLVEVCEKYGKY